MADYVYTTVPGKLRTLLAKIREVGVPSKVTKAWLKSIGFTSSNDASLIGVIKYIGFAESSSGVPTEKWSQFRGARSKKVLGDAVQQAYADLFSVYTDAYQRSRAELENVFSTSSKGGKEVIGKLVSTFKALADEAEFTPPERQTDLQVSSGPLHSPVVPQNSAIQTGASTSCSGPSVHIDVQVHISPEAGPDQIEQIFASMAKHLFGKAKN